MALVESSLPHADLSAFVKPKSEDEGLLELLVAGAHCAGCMAKVEGEICRLPGVSAARLNLSTGKLAVSMKRSGDPGVVLETLERIGYPATLFDPEAAEAAQDREGRAITMALAVAAFGAGNAMMFSVPIWAGLFGQELGPATRTLMQWASAAIGAPCAVFAGMIFFKSAWRSLKAGQANMDVPISIGVLLTLAVSFQETLLHGRDTYFDAAVTLLFLLLIGRWLDHSLRRKARGAAADLLALQASTAILLDDLGHERRVPLREVMPGDLILVRPGERIPVDGRITSGRSDLDNAILTGETAAVPVKIGETCRAGAMNLNGALTVVALARSEDSTLAEIARLVEAGSQSKSAYVRLADKAAAIYVPVVHSAAALTFVLGWGLGLSPREALLRAATVLIITCPCALGLAAPAVQVAASSRLFRRGILVKSGIALERLAEVNRVFLDKTGVVTEGRPRMLAANPLEVERAALLARASAHPLAKALAREAGPGPMAEDVEEAPGQGVEGVIAGRTYRLGRADYVGGHAGASGETELWFGELGETPICFRFADSVRSDAADTVAALRKRGCEVDILSGDLEGPTASAARSAGVMTWRSQLTPQDKAAAVEAATARGDRILMVGDGLNDVAALSNAYAAMAPGTALDASQNAADLIFSCDKLGAVVEAIDVARAAKHRALENFAFAALYNLIAGPAAMAGLINPFIAALAMSGSSLVVTLNALRLLRGGYR